MLVKEARAVKEAVEHFAVFIEGCPVALCCDHKPLERFLEAQTRNEMVNRWSLEIQRFDLKFEWVSSEKNLSDCLSQMNDAKLFQDHNVMDADFPVKPIRQEIDPKTHMSKMVQTERRVSDQCSATQIEEAQLMSEDVVEIKKISKLTDEQFLSFQECDGYCKRIKAQIKTARPDKNGLFVVRDKLLYRAVLHNKKRGSFALVILCALRLSVLVNIHKELVHPGWDKMIAVLKPWVFWKGMVKQITQFVKGCRVCQLGELKRDAHRMIRIQPPVGPGLRLAVDVWSIDGCMALTAIDLHSQYPFAEPLQDKSATQVCTALQNILAYMRTPQEILSDNGSEFKNKDFARLLKSCNIRHRLTAPYSPQSNGVLERFHCYLNEVYRKAMTLRVERDWWSVVRGALETYRKLPHTETGEAPLFLWSGQEPTYNIDHLLLTLSRGYWSFESESLNLADLWIAQACGRRNLCLARCRKDQSRKKGNCGKIRKLQISDRVYRENIHPEKHEARWDPGYRIIQFVNQGQRQVWIEHTETKKHSCVNLRHLRWCDPISELLDNTSVDVFPGCSQLYLTVDDITDLNWNFTTQMPELSEEQRCKMNEIVHERENELYEQKNPNKCTSTDKPMHDAPSPKRT